MTLVSFTPAAAGDGKEGPGRNSGLSASEFKSSGERFKEECPSQNGAEGCLLFVSDGVSDMEAAALAYSLYHLDGKGIDAYLHNLSAERRSSAQEKLDALNESPEALKRAAVIGYADTEFGNTALAPSTILTTRDAVQDFEFGFCSETCTVLQVVTIHTSLEQTFFPEMNLFGDITATNGTFQVSPFDCRMWRRNFPFPDTVAHDFTTCSPMQFPSSYRQIFLESWEHESYLGQSYHMVYEGLVTPRPDILADWVFEYASQRHWIDFAGNFAWQDL
ncbi:hypothetical protein ACO229_06735 [Promicromonospora sp. MS192]|uniref:hypothetical protein n=1 Tax=Promicromonospora sp. MS192 TaxID=3412684 RepID=UPI003C2E6156